MSRLAASPPEPKTAQRGRLLIVDDEEVIASTLPDFLSGEGFDVSVAHAPR